MRPLETTPETHGPLGIGYADLPPAPRSISDRHGVDVLLEEARRRPREIQLVTLGPLTNLAVALEREPAPAEPARRADRHGRRLRRARQRVADDRMEHVLRSGRRADRVRGVGPGDRRGPDRPAAAGHGARRDRTGPAPAGARRAGSPGAPAARRTTRSRSNGAKTRWSRPGRSRATRSSGSSPMHSATTWSSTPATTASTAPSSTIHWPSPPPWIARSSRPRRWAVDVETSGRLTTGMTVADRRRTTGHTPNADVAVTADADEFLERLIDRVGGLAADRASLSR